MCCCCSAGSPGNGSSKLHLKAQLQQLQKQHQLHVKGYADFVQRHVLDLLCLVLHTPAWSDIHSNHLNHYHAQQQQQQPPPQLSSLQQAVAGSTSSSSQPAAAHNSVHSPDAAARKVNHAAANKLQTVFIGADEFDRLEFLLQPVAGATDVTSGSSTLSTLHQQQARLSSLLPQLSSQGAVSLESAVSWLSHQLLQQEKPTGRAGSSTDNPFTPLGSAGPYDALRSHPINILGTAGLSSPSRSSPAASEPFSRTPLTVATPVSSPARLEHRESSPPRATASPLDAATNSHAVSSISSPVLAPGVSPLYLNLHGDQPTPLTSPPSPFGSGSAFNGVLSPIATHSDSNGPHLGSSMRVCTARGTVAVSGGQVDDRFIQGVYRGTVVRGERDCPAGEVLIQDCSDCHIYVLTALR